MSSFIEDIKLKVEEFRLRAHSPEKRERAKQHKDNVKQAAQIGSESVADSPVAFIMHCKLPTKSGRMKDYDLKQQGLNLLLTREKSKKKPMIVLALDSFQCLIKNVPIKGSASLLKSSENPSKALVLAHKDRGQLRVFFDRPDALLTCKRKIRECQRFTDVLSEYKMVE